ncbi:MAG: hypothetical protein J7L62_00935 [Candidatus Aminicenantes bacterium]|nr:hypothetical protein [Candidatus Aminicenantes bacterium]
MARAKVIDHYVALKEDKEGLGVLGVIVWFSIGDMRVPRKALEDAFKKYKIPDEYMPHPLRPVDAFRKATKSIEKTFHKRNKKGEVTEEITILVRETITGEKKVIRRLVKEVKIPSKDRLSYETEFGRAVFHRDNTRVVVEIKDPEYTWVEDKILWEYEVFKNSYDGNGIRRMVRNILYQQRPIMMRPAGSVYFIPRENQKIVYKLADMVNELAKSYASSLWETIFLITPFLDISQNRDLVVTRWKLYVKETLEKVYKEFKEKYEKGKLNKKEVEQYKKLLEKIAEQNAFYGKSLKTQIKSVENMLTDLSSKLLEVKLAEVSVNGEK